MQKSFLTTMLAIGVAVASLTSCSRANYAFNPAGPSYLGTEWVHAAAPVAEPVLTASNEDAAPASIASPARVAAAALAHRTTPAAAKVASVSAGPVAAHQASLTKEELKVLKKQLRQVVKQNKKASPNSVAAEGKSQLVAVLLCFFLGGLGIHDFYMGYIGKGILQIFLSLILVGFILVIIDFIRLLTGSLKPKDGDFTTKL